MAPWGVRQSRLSRSTKSSSSAASGSAAVFGPPQDGWWRLKSPRRRISGLFSWESSLSSSSLTSGSIEALLVGSSCSPRL